MLCATPLILIVFAILSILLILPTELPSYPRVDVHNIASTMLQKLELGHRTMQNILLQNRSPTAGGQFGS